MSLLKMLTSRNEQFLAFVCCNNLNVREKNVDNKMRAVISLVHMQSDIESEFYPLFW